MIPARESDREKIYRWLCESDITPSVMGSPLFPDHPVPTREEFLSEYPLSFFNSSGDGAGRVFIILADDVEAGTIGYDLMDKEKNRVVLDLWMRAEKYCGRGFGSDALKAMCGYLNREFGISNFFISPSARNKRAIAAYKKAGFEPVKTLNKKEQEDEWGIFEYDDNVLMRKKLMAMPSSGLK